ncbi:type II toxin-antitoxin system HicB family antitoxin [Pseudomonas sp. CFBP 8770]|uniref:type II toxin-antitoxin system HicB family antitoxin n=1 Tax=unclassified Pseudomonas TaxID=196821 RepID=UPI0017865528|nr:MULTISPECIES: type II toxin-antitoxin system HicB family antitoxin [unclassified Pseudomonas]MBD8473757.1 type II toxin-antitoxin system HicB family antitoxin [Pseudomonas sp. CFBP 8773]MBD8646885.1 type II toxin-antitoxin system HicB family antitoxin [Pseudomonas sp. CFBP 8770]
MRYPICIEWSDENTAVGIQVPDIPGAITAGDTFEEAYSAAIEIAHIMLQDIATRGASVPLPSAMSGLRSDPEYADMGWGMLDVDITPYLGKTEKVNVTLPGFVISQIDRFVREHNVKSRSSFLTDAALEKLGR